MGELPARSQFSCGELGLSDSAGLRGFGDLVVALTGGRTMDPKRRPLPSRNAVLWGRRTSRCDLAAIRREVESVRDDLRLLDHLENAPASRVVWRPLSRLARAPRTVHSS